MFFSLKKFFHIIVFFTIIILGCKTANFQSSKEKSFFKIFDIDQQKNDLRNNFSELPSEVLETQNYQKKLQDSFIVGNHKSFEDCSLHLQWDQLPGIEHYKIFMRSSPLIYYDFEQDSFLKKDNPLWNFISIYHKSEKQEKVKYMHNILSCSRNIKKKNFPLLFQEYEYIVTAFSGSNDNSSLFVKMPSSVKAYLLPQNLRSILNDFQTNIIPGLYETDGFCGLNICKEAEEKDDDDDDKTTEDVRIETKGLNNGSYELKKNNDSVQYKWSNYSNYNGITINGILEGKILPWIGKKKFGKKIILQGNIKITGLYIAEIIFQNLVIFDQENIAKIHGINPDKDSGSLIVNYNGKTEKFTAGKNNFHRKDLQMIYIGRFKDIKKYLTNKSAYLSVLFKKPSYIQD